MMYSNVVFSINISIKIRTRPGYDFLLVAGAHPPLWAWWASSQALAETFTYLPLTRLFYGCMEWLTYKVNRKFPGSGHNPKSFPTSYDDYFQT